MEEAHVLGLERATKIDALLRMLQQAYRPFCRDLG
jgi:hypothetical protein